MANASRTSGSPVDVARDAVVHQRQVLDDWEDRRHAAQTELAQLESTAGADVVADPDAAMAVSRRITELREFDAVAEKAIATQQGHVETATATYLNAEADALKPALADAGAKVTAHRVAVAELIQKLTDLDGHYVPEIELRQLRYSLDSGYREPLRPLQSHRLEVERVRIERRIEVLRAMADGEDPRPLIRKWEASERFHDSDNLRYYPDCLWKPGAIVEAPVLRDRRVRAERWLRDLEVLQAELPAEIEVCRAQMNNPVDGPALMARAKRLSRRLEELPAEIELARSELAETA